MRSVLQVSWSYKIWDAKCSGNYFDKEMVYISVIGEVVLFDLKTEGDLVDVVARIELIHHEVTMEKQVQCLLGF